MHGSLNIMAETTRSFTEGYLRFLYFSNSLSR
uniref:Uncharacterized protein n=1 Tax=Anguilla anguilla TaxID=7936 RepID=A0A0E9V5M0_ANGAN